MDGLASIQEVLDLRVSWKLKLSKIQMWPLQSLRFGGCSLAGHILERQVL
jgi:hypothetical protein